MYKKLICPLLLAALAAACTGGKVQETNSVSETSAAVIADTLLASNPVQAGIDLQTLYTTWFSAPYEYMFEESGAKTPVAGKNYGIYLAGTKGILDYGSLSQSAALLLGEQTPYQDFMDYTVFGRLSGITPYTRIIDFDKQNTDFRYINPAIVKWGYENLLPAPDMVVGGQSCKVLYDNVFQRFGRIMTESYVEINTEYDYAEEQKKYLEAMRLAETNKYSFDALSYFDMNYDPAGKYGLQDYTRLTYGQAMGFWLRRGIDGSHTELWEGLTRAMNLYDSDWFAKNNLQAGNRKEEAIKNLMAGVAKKPLEASGLLLSLHYGGFEADPGVYTSLWITHENGEAAIKNEFGFLAVPLANGFAYVDVLSAFPQENMCQESSGWKALSFLDINTSLEAHYAGRQAKTAAALARLAEMSACKEFQEVPYINFAGNGLLSYSSYQFTREAGSNENRSTNKRVVLRLSDMKESNLSEFYGADGINRLAGMLKKPAESQGTEVVNENLSCWIARNKGRFEAMVYAGNHYDTNEEESKRSLAFHVSMEQAPLPASFAKNASIPEKTWDALTAVYPTLQDAFLSPNGNLLVVIEGGTLRAFDTASGKQLIVRRQVMPSYEEEGAPSIVLVEWAAGTQVAAWDKALPTPEQKAANAPTN